MMMKTKRMMRVTALLMMAVFLLSLAACGSKTNTAETQAQPTQNATAAETKAADAQNATTAGSTDSATEGVSNGSKTLVVYFSATGTTKGVAQNIANATGADT